MALTTKNGPTGQEWAAHRPEIERLYMKDDASLSSVMAIMESKYGFIAKKHQYERKLKLEWKLQKNIASPKIIWRAVAAHVRLYAQKSQKCEVFIYGKMKPFKTVRREIRRYGRRDNSLLKTSPLPPLPPGVIVRPAVAPLTVPITIELPFQCFERHFVNSLITGDQKDYIAKSPTVFPEDSGRGITFTAISYENMGRALQRLVPCSVFPPESLSAPQSNPHTSLFASPFHRGIVYSIANNFAGTEILPKAMVLNYLRSQRSEGLYQMIQSMPHLYATQALALNLFYAAIEVGDEKMADFILTNSQLGITANNILHVKGAIYTPLGLAAKLGHRALVKVLLNHRANITIISPAQNLGLDVYNVFDAAVTGTKISEKLDIKLLKLLLDAGAEPNISTFKCLIHRYCQFPDIGCEFLDQLVLLIIERFVSNRWRCWSQGRIFIELFKEYRQESLLKVLSFMVEKSVDLNFFAVCPDNTNSPATIIDTVANRGDFFMVRKLCEVGATLTDDTLSLSITSKNEALVSYVLRHPARTRGRSYHRETPLSAAIRCQNDKILAWITADRCLMAQERRSGFKSALRAASCSGNTMWINGLLQDPEIFNSKELGIALAEAASAGNQDVIYTLLSAGADTNIAMPEDSSGKTPLYWALVKGDINLIRTLLSEDANPNFADYPGDSSVDPAIVLAVMTGNQDIVDLIINAGADINAAAIDGNSALSAAVEKKDKAMVDFLTLRGCDINAGLFESGRISALSAAVETDDIDMIAYVLDLGADPHDLQAIISALEALTGYSKIIDLILRKHQDRYRGKRPWGADILCYAIEFDDYELFQKMLRFGGNPSGSPEEWRPIGGDAYMTPFGLAVGDSASIGLKYTELILQGNAYWPCVPESIVSDTTWSNTTRSNRTNPVSCETAFLVAIGTGYLPIIELLLDKQHADVNFPAEIRVKRTPLQKAAEVGKIEIVRLLLDRGADVNAPAAKRGGGTALQLASMKGKLNVVHLLLERGADVNAPASDINGRTALEGAAEHGRLDVVQLLLSILPKTEARDSFQISTAASLAQKNGWFPIVSMLNAFTREGTFSNQEASPSLHGDSLNTETARVSTYGEDVDWGEFIDIDCTMSDMAGDEGGGSRGTVFDLSV